MSLPIQPNSVIGTRLMDLLSRVGGSNEIATFGFSNNNTGVKLRFYDNNNPASGGLLGYSSSNYTFNFTRDSGSLNVGINTTVATAAFQVAGDYTLTGSLITSNLIVTGSSFVPISVSGGITSTVGLYNPTGTNYKDVITNDTTASNCILMNMNLGVGRYLFTTALSFTNLDPSFTPATNFINLGVYSATVGNFSKTAIPLQSANVVVSSTTDPMATSVTFVLDVSQSMNYVVAVIGEGQYLRFSGTGYLVNIGGFGTDDASTQYQKLQVAPIRQTQVVASSSNVFSFSTPGIYSISSSDNVEVFRNGIKFANYSPTSNDYTAYYTNSTTSTTFTVVTQQNLVQNDILDMTVWPTTLSTTFTNSYFYQDIANQTLTTIGLNVNTNTGYVGMGTFTPPQPLSVYGQSYFSSNMGIGITNPTALLSINDAWNDGMATLTVQQIPVGVEFPPVGISNIYFAPDYTDTIPSIDISSSLSNLEYPPSAMTNYDTLLPSTYGAGTYMAGASTEYSTSYRTWMAFNKTLASGWASTTAYNTSGVYTGSYTTLDTNGVVYYGEWLQLQLPVGIILNSYALCGGANAYEFPKSWYILGSVDGNNWTLVDTQTNITTISSTVYRFFTVSNLTRTFNFYRMVTNTTQGGAGGASDVYILEWRLFTNMTTFQNRYPKYKGTIPYYTSQNSYGLGQYQIWANTIQDYSFSNQAVPSGLFTKTVGNTSNTVWASYSNVYTRTVDTVSSNLPIIYAQFPDLIQLNYYSITARGGNALETPSKWTLFGSNTAISSSWQTVDSESDITYWSAFQTSNFPVSGSNAYNFYKMELYRNSSLVPTRMSMGELRFFGSKQTPEPCLVVATNGFVGFGTTNPVSSLDIQGDLYLSGNLCNSLMRIGPNVTFDGSSNNRDTFLRWMQYVTSTDYRFALQPRRLASSTWWNAGNSVTLYDGYTYSTIATGLTLNAGSYVGATLMMDGRVLLNPFNATTIGLFDPSNNSYTSATTHLTVGQTSFIGSVLLPNGKVVCVPYGSTTIGIFNPSTNLFSTISIGGTGLYAGGVLLPDGRVIFVQTSSSYIGFFNPSTNVYTSYNTGLTGTNLFEGGVLLPDGRVVMVPRNATYIGIYNSITNTYTTTAVGNLPGSTAYSGGIHLPDGRILFAPCSATTIGLFNPYTNTFSTILGAPGSTAFFGGVLLPDGRVIFVPHSAAYVGVFNPFTNTYTTMLSAPGSSAYVGGRTLPDGRIILVPYYATTVGILTPTQIPRPPPLELCYHPCFNKY